MCAERLNGPSRAGADYDLEYRRNHCSKCYEGDDEEDPYGLQLETDEDMYGDDYEQNTGYGDVIKLCPVVTTSVPRLKEMSSLNVAISLYNNLNVAFLMSTKNKYHSDFGCLLNEKVLASSMKLPVPKSVAEEIVKYINAMKCQLKRWVSYLYPKIFYNHKSVNYVYNFIHHVVWLPNCDIDGKQTARSLVTCDRLSNIEKYHILCLYCLKDELEIISASLFQKKIVNYVNLNEHPLIFYWNCYFNDTLEKIPVSGGISMSNFMFNHRRVDNWPAKEYFFERLSYDEQIQNVISFIDKYGSKYQDLLLTKLDETQRFHVFFEKSVEIIQNHTDIGDIIRTWNEIRNLVNQDQFVQIFNALLNKNIDESILINIWTNAPDNFKEYLLNSNNHRIIAKPLGAWVYNNDNDLFFIMISNATANIKKSIAKEWFFSNSCVELMRLGQLQMMDKLFSVFFLNEEDSLKFRLQLANEDVFGSYCDQLINEGNLNYLDLLLHSMLRWTDQIAQFKRDMAKQQFFYAHCETLIVNHRFTQLDYLLSSFLLQPELILNFKRELTKRQYFLDHCDVLISHNELTQLDYLLNSLLLKPDLVLEFKKNLVISSKIIKLYCFGCYRSGNVENLNNFLSMILPSSPDFIFEYKRALILSNDGKSQCLSLIDSEVDLSGIISDSLPPEMVSEYKKQLIFTPSIIAIFNSHLHSALLNRITTCIDRYLTSAEDKAELKKRIVGNPMDLILAMFRKYPETVWNSVVLWWHDNEQSLSNFIATLPINDVFDELLKESIFVSYDSAHRLNKCKFKSDITFGPLDRFLIWVFKTPAKIKEYKLGRVDSYAEIDMIKTLLRKKDGRYLKAVMRWFFQDNDADIEWFKTKNRGRKILNFL